ncbi:MAG: hypothetical protein J6X10_06130 [Bacteroidales bacterium]|nr:hypothetical protein [Bacteroidales bacterium]
MKKSITLLLIVAFFLTLTTISCKKEKQEDPEKTYSELIVGRWKTSAAEPYYEVYYSDGTGKMWDEGDDVHEDEADTFDWSIDNEDKLTQIVHYHEGGAVVPQYCNILILNETRFKYNNEGWRATYDLQKVN